MLRLVSTLLASRSTKETSKPRLSQGGAFPQIPDISEQMWGEKNNQKKIEQKALKNPINI